MQSTSLFICLILVQYTMGLYIKTIDDEEEKQQHKSASTKSGNHQVDLNEWGSFQRKLGLTDQTVEVLKSQKDQKVTMELLNRFMKENPKYVTISADKHKQGEEANNFFDTYHTIVERLRKAQGTLKTTLNFELADKSTPKDLKRSRRKIAVRMVSDMPSDKIDDLLEMFNQQHGLNRSDNNDDDDEHDADGETSVEYNGIEPLALPSAMDPDYMYENLYEDEEDTAAPSKPYGSFQDLILQATRNQWQRELEETKLHSKTNEHFV